MSEPVPLAAKLSDPKLGGNRGPSQAGFSFLNRKETPPTTFFMELLLQEAQLCVPAQTKLNTVSLLHPHLHSLPFPTESTPETALFID